MGRRESRKSYMLLQIFLSYDFRDWELIKDKDELIVAQVCMRKGIPS